MIVYDKDLYWVKVKDGKLVDINSILDGSLRLAIVVADKNIVHVLTEHNYNSQFKLEDVTKQTIKLVSSNATDLLDKNNAHISKFYKNGKVRNIFKKAVKTNGILSEEQIQKLEMEQAKYYQNNRELKDEEKTLLKMKQRIFNKYPTQYK